MNRLVCVRNDHKLCILDADSGEVIRIVNIADSLFGPVRLSVRFSCCRDGHHLIASCAAIISIWKTNFDSSLDLSRTYSCPHLIFCVCVNDVDSHFVTGHEYGFLYYWDTESGELLWSRNVHDGQTVRTVDISLDGALIVSGGYDDLVRICSAKIGEQIYQCLGHTQSIYSLQFSPDISRMASGSYDKTVRIWDVASQAQVMLLEGHTGCVTSLSYSYDGTRLATGSHDNVVMIWDVETGDCLWVLRGHTKLVRSVSFNSDASRLVSGGGDKRIIIWDCVTGCEIQRIESSSPSVTSVRYLPAVSDYLLK